MVDDFKKIGIGLGVTLIAIEDAPNLLLFSSI
jgi:hypothetical protein